MRTKLYLIAALTVLVAGTLFWVSRHPGYLANIYLQRYRTQALSNTSNLAWTERHIDPLLVRYQAQDPGAAEVLAALPQAVARVQAAFPRLPDRAYVFVFPDRATATSGFGYDFPTGFNGAGMGSDMLVMVSPAAWSPAERSAKPVDKIVTHELTHLAVFNLGGPSVPKWLTEGLAVYVADQITAPLGAAGKAYSLHEVSDLFEEAESLTDVGQGYKLAGSVVKFMVDRYGLTSVQEVLVELGSGRTLDQALRAVIGTDLHGLEKAWHESLFT